MVDSFTTPDDISQSMKQHKKFVPRMGKFSAIATLLAVTPIWLFVLLPGALVSQLIILIKRKLAGRPAPRVIETVSSEEQKDSTSERKYDIVVYGATGFTGKLAVRYLTTQYGDKVRWAIAGRNRASLEAVNNQVPIIVANADDRAALTEMVRSTKAVVSLAGPFAKLGSLLVKICAENGTHYVDITGETAWVQDMIVQNDELARKTGARIVNMCGHDCVPWDLMVSELALALKEKGDELREVQCFDESNASPSGGTLNTIFYTLANPPVKSSSFNPLLRLPNGEKARTQFKAASPATLAFSKTNNTWVGPNVMAMVMAKCVNRSQVLLGYSDNLTYSESLVFPDFWTGCASVVSLYAGATAILIPPLASLLLETGILPKPGDGPSQEQMDKGFLKITGRGKGVRGGTVAATMYFPNDPGYRDTARMAVESGLALALEGDKLESGGGVLTPASCLGRVLLNRLIATGTKFSLH